MTATREAPSGQRRGPVVKVRAAWKGEATRGSRLRHVPLHVASIVIGLTIVVPVLFGVLGGFKDNGQLTTNPFGLPKPWVWINYTEILGSQGFWRPLLNSTVIAIATTVLVTGVSALAAFVFARFAFRGRELLFTLFTIGLMFPFAVAILPLYVLLREM
jgi:raffinose/stachyose/melibiose transport system permease protein